MRVLFALLASVVLTLPLAAVECVAVDPIGFGPCDLFLGWAWTGGGCEPVSGCSTVDDQGNDLGAWIHPDLDRCYESCGACPVMDPFGFGPCEVFLGWGFTGNACQGIGGCSTVDELGRDLGEWFFADEVGCLHACDDCPVLDPDGFGDCQLPLGFAWTGAACDGVSGCSTVDPDGVDQADWFFDDPFACLETCDRCPVLDPDGFGDCDAVLGVGWTGGGCHAISGCGPVDDHGNDRSDWIFDDVETCLAACVAGPTLRPPQPSTDGRLRLVALRVSPGEPVAFVLSDRLGRTAVPGCPGLFVDLRDPRPFGFDRASAAGVLALEREIPAAAAGRFVRFQVVDRASCSTSNLVEAWVPTP